MSIKRFPNRFCRMRGNSIETGTTEANEQYLGFLKVEDSQGGIRVNLTPKMHQSLLNVTPRSQMMPNFALPLHKYDSKKRLNWQQVLLRLAPALVKVNDLTPLYAKNFQTPRRRSSAWST